MQGFEALPLLVGHDDAEPDPLRSGKIVSFDITGNVVIDSTGYESIGSGSPYAKAAMKKRYSPGADRAAAVRTAVEALYDAADDDSATGGPDLVRGIYPLVVTITGADGAVRLPDGEVEAAARDVVRAREGNPGG
jgi:proteasome beta subunit